jgi:predicted nucleic acid-binding protein
VLAGPGDLESLRIRIAQLGIVGGSVYDALVGQAALVNERTLLTRDQRAERIYRALGVAHEMVE